jgi:hypothetical protein
VEAVEGRTAGEGPEGGFRSGWTRKTGRRVKRFHRIGREKPGPPRGIRPLNDGGNDSRGRAFEHRRAAIHGANRLLGRGARRAAVSRDRGHGRREQNQGQGKSGSAGTHLRHRNYRRLSATD